MITRITHMGIHVPQDEELVASFIPAFGRRVIAHLGVLSQMLQLHNFSAAPCMVVTLNVQLQNQVLQWQYVVELFSGDSLTLHGAAALLDDPGKNAAGAEDVTARSGERVFQNFVAQVAFEIRVHRPFKPVQLKSHFPFSQKNPTVGVSHKQR